MICHGRSSSKAIKNAILQAQVLAKARLIEQIRGDIAHGVLEPAAQSTVASQE
jgi:fatty acid/phospholipid biosynthesis enzyme